ncbi:hypothetical protein GCM10010341_22460 [Streptomyces noursei]|nr:hypothetical protein GCM10010341_22460 [Streptomyces noursei]
MFRFDGAVGAGGAGLGQPVPTGVRVAVRVLVHDGLLSCGLFLAIALVRLFRFLRSLPVQATPGGGRRQPERPEVARRRYRRSFWYQVTSQ